MRSLGLADALLDVGGGLCDLARWPLGAGALRKAPRGEGHAVLVLPGFLAGDRSTLPLRSFLKRIGYRAYPWALGTNLGFSGRHTEDIESLIEQRLKEVLVRSGAAQLSLIGWSLGGLYAKQLARRHPALIREIITLGSPISGDLDGVGVRRLYEWVSGTRLKEPRLQRKLKTVTAPLKTVPLTAIYSLNDGVVPPANAREPEGPLVQNIEVAAAHTGLGFDAFVMYAIAQRLSLSAQGPWQPLDIDELHRRYTEDRSLR